MHVPVKTVITLFLFEQKRAGYRDRGGRKLRVSARIIPGRSSTAKVIAQTMNIENKRNIPRRTGRHARISNYESA